MVEQARLLANDPAAADAFGSAVAVDNNTVVVGAPAEDSSILNADRGAAYVYVRSGPNWVLQQKLTASDNAIGDNFGTAVAIQGDTIVVGAPGDDSSIINLDRGSAYVFTRSGSTWTQRAKLTAGDAGNFDHFGSAVALDNGTIAIGAPDDDRPTGNDQGSIYVFTGSGASWTQQSRLNAGDGNGGDNLGVSVAISGETILGGAPGEDVPGDANVGAAYVFLRTGSSWAQQAKLFASDRDDDNRFGFSVSLDGDTAAIGSPGLLTNTTTVGAAYVFNRSDVTWTEEAELVPPTTQIRFGTSVALKNNALVAGSPAEDLGAGATYLVFDRTSEGWTLGQRLLAGDRGIADAFGATVAFDGTHIAIGAPINGVSETLQGAAYVFAHGPNAVNDATATAVNAPVTITVTSNDTDLEGDALDVFQFSNPSHGGLVKVGAGTLTYTPANGFVGLDSFTYKANDANSISNLATVYVWVGVNDVTSVSGINVLRVVPNTATRTYLFYVQVTDNLEAPLAPPLSLVVDGLPAGVTLSSASGRTTGSNSPYVNSSAWLGSGKSQVFTLRFTSTTPLSSLPGSVRLLTGIGAR